MKRLISAFLLIICVLHLFSATAFAQEGTAALFSATTNGTGAGLIKPVYFDESGTTVSKTESLKYGTKLYIPLIGYDAAAAPVTDDSYRLSYNIQKGRDAIEKVELVKAPWTACGNTAIQITLARLPVTEKTDVQFSFFLRNRQDSLKNSPTIYFDSEVFYPENIVSEVFELTDSTDEAVWKGSDSRMNSVITWTDIAEYSVEWQTRESAKYLSVDTSMELDEILLLGGNDVNIAKVSFPGAPRFQNLGKLSIKKPDTMDKAYLYIVQPDGTLVPADRFVYNQETRSFVVTTRVLENYLLSDKPLTDTAVSSSSDENAAAAPPEKSETEPPSAPVSRPAKKNPETGC